ncbi:MAG: magnesium transporter CorA family protein [Ardenticatenaceae bacterium]|nr:magnesium transporter CorA family protein [Ardenticatenaceae bacterium]
MTTENLQYGRVTWINITNPTREDLDVLSRQYPNFHPLHLGDSLSELEFPKLDVGDDYLFIVAQLPRWNGEARICYPAEIDIFVASGVLVTVHNGEIKPLNEMFATAEADEAMMGEMMGKGASPLLYQLMDTLVRYCDPILEKVNQTIRQIELSLFEEDMEHILYEVAVARRGVIAIRHILRPQLDVVRELERGSWPFIQGHLDMYWDDVGDHLTRLLSMLDEHVEVIGGLSDTVDTLASHRIDGVVRLLTLITILTVPLTVLSTIFGMNVALPYGDHPLPFYLINVIGIVMTAGVIWYLHRRRWL